MVSTRMYPPENLHRTSHSPSDPKDNHRLGQFTWEGSLKIRIPGRVSPWHEFHGLLQANAFDGIKLLDLDRWSTEIHWTTDFIPFTIYLPRLPNGATTNPQHQRVDVTDFFTHFQSFKQLWFLLVFIMDIPDFWWFLCGFSDRAALRPGSLWAQKNRQRPWVRHLER